MNIIILLKIFFLGLFIKNRLVRFLYLTLVYYLLTIIMLVPVYIYNNDSFRDIFYVIPLFLALYLWGAIAGGKALFSIPIYVIVLSLFKKKITYYKAALIFGVVILILVPGFYVIHISA